MKEEPLADRLAALAPGSIVLIHGPAGYGKTMQLSSFAGCARANGRLVVDLGREFKRLEASRDRWQAFLRSIETDGARGVLLIADDFGLESALPFQTAIESVPRESVDPPTFIIAGRHLPVFSLVEQRLRNRVFDFGRDDLALGEAAIAAWAAGDGVEVGRIEPLIGLADGWPALLEIAIRLARFDDPTCPVTMTRFQAEAFDYFGNSIAAALSQDLVSFLFRLAIPQKIDACLASRLTGTADCSVLFEQLVAEGLPLQRSRSAPNEWSFHPLFRRFLQEKACAPGLDVDALHRITVEHFGSAGQPEEALRHAAEAGRLDDALALIEEAGGWRLVMKGMARELGVALARIGEDERRLPRAVLTKAFLLAKEGRVQAARKLLGNRAPPPPCTSGRVYESTQVELDHQLVDTHEFELDHQLVDTHEFELDYQLVDTHVRIYEDHVMTEQDEDRLHALIAALPAGDLLGRALATNHLCTVTMHLGEFALSQRYAETAMRLYEDAGAHFGALHLHAHLGQMRFARGDLTGAEREYVLMEEHLHASYGEHAELVAIARALRSEVAYEMNDIALASELLSDAMATVEDSDAWLDVLASTFRVYTRLAFLRAGLPGALSALAHAEKLASERRMPRLLRLLQIERLRALTLSDELEEAEKAMYQADLGRYAQAEYPTGKSDWAMRQGSTAVAVARFLVRTRRGDLALRLLATAEAWAMQAGQMLSVAKLRIVGASARWRLGRTDEAVVSLIQAVRLLGNQPFRRFILDEGPPVARIVQSALDGDLAGGRRHCEVHKKLSELNHLATLSQARAPRYPPPAGMATTGGVSARADEDALPNRYLQLLSMGLSNKEIARTLGVSDNTVKYHLKALYRELCVDSRSRAVFRARELGLIDS